MYNFRPRNKSDNIRKYYIEDDMDSFSPKKDKKKTKNKTKAKTKNKMSNKKSLNIKPEKTKIKQSNKFFPITSFISEFHSQIDYPKTKSKKYYENKSKEKIIIPPNKKDIKRKKESNTNFLKEYEIKTENHIKIKKEELEEYDYTKDIDENKKRYNTIHAYQNDKITKGKIKKEQNKKSTKRGNIKIYEKTKESIPKKKNNIKTKSKIEKSVNKSFNYDKSYNKYNSKSYSSLDIKKATNKSNINNDKKNNNNYKYGSSYNKSKFKVILDESEEEKEISNVINIKNIKILEKDKNYKYKKDKSKPNQKEKCEVEKGIKNKAKTKIKKEENNNNLVKIHNNIIDINKSLLNVSSNLNQHPLHPICTNQKNLINKTKASKKCILKTKFNDFCDKLFKYNDDDLEKYKFSTCQIDDELLTITINRFPKSNDIETKIKLEENEDKDKNNINLLGNKRKRNIKKEKLEDKKSNKKTKKRNKKENKEKEEKIKKEKQLDKEIQKTKNKKNKSIKNENQKIKKTKISNIKETLLKKEEFYEDNYDYEYDYCDDIINNSNIINVKIKRKRGTKKHCSMKKKEIVEVKVKKLDNKVEKEKENYEDDYMTSSCSSLADGDKNMQKLSINDSKNSKKNDNNKNKSIIVIKSEENSENSEIEKCQKMEGEDSPIFSLYKNIVDGDIENKEIKDNNISYDNYNDIIINKNNIIDFSNKQYSYSSFENSFDYSFPIEYEDKIQIKEDVTYFGKNTRYIKYNPIDEYTTPIPIKDKKNFRNKITKPKHINFFNKSKNDYNTIDSDLTDITSSNNNNFDNGNDNELPAILCIPRIKPFKDEHSKNIINKLKNCRIPQHKILDENMEKEEQKLYIGSFILYDENTNIKVNVPCYRENEITKEFMRKKNLGIIEFQEDNDIDTDEEQLQLEVERNNEALINFMKKVENDREYVENNLTRKKRE